MCAKIPPRSTIFNASWKRNKNNNSNNNTIRQKFDPSPLKPNHFSHSFFFHLSFQKAHPTLNGQFFADRTIRRNPRKMFWRLRERKRRKKGGGEKRREKKKPEQEKRLTLDGFRGRFNGKEHFCSDDERSWQIFSSLSPSISLRPFFFTSSFFFFLTTKR